MTTDLHPGPLEPLPSVPAPAGKSAREKRWERRRRRIWLEEVLGWVLVPVILVGFYLLIEAVLAALGTSVSAVADGIRMVLSTL